MNSLLYLQLKLYDLEQVIFLLQDIWAVVICFILIYYILHCDPLCNYLHSLSLVEIKQSHH